MPKYRISLFHSPIRWIPFNTHNPHNDQNHLRHLKISICRRKQRTIVSRNSWMSPKFGLKAVPSKAFTKADHLSKFQEMTSSSRKNHPPKQIKWYDYRHVRRKFMGMVYNVLARHLIISPVQFRQIRLSHMSAASAAIPKHSESPHSSLPLSLTSSSQSITTTDTPSRPPSYTHFQPVNNTTLTGPYISVAPMLDITDPHFRFLLRLISPNPNHITLYTEMKHPYAVITHKSTISQFMGIITPGTIPQLGGSDPVAMAKAADILYRNGYIDESLGININVGCPASSAKEGTYGAVLMLSPDQVAGIATAISKVLPSHIPISVKCRIGVDKNDSDEFVEKFMTSIVRNSPVRWFVLHARKAILKGLNPRQNLKVPPLNYERVYRMRSLFPDLRLEINGGIATVESVAEQFENGMDGVMIGRKISRDPFFIESLDKHFYASSSSTPSSSATSLQTSDNSFSSILQPRNDSPILKTSPSPSTLQNQLLQTDTKIRTRDQILYSYALYADYIHTQNPLRNKLNQLIRPTYYIFPSSDGKFFRGRILQRVRDYVHSNSSSESVASTSNPSDAQSKSFLTTPYNTNIKPGNGIVMKIIAETYDEMIRNRDYRDRGFWSVGVKKSR
ncbi:dihydrouridine synthase-domain-containing protein [Paraphysoderma sedebokerense]|nr:dihydrouridine synthase-domain-containing protein [Paraphysoderma sedebokerense]